MKIKAIIFFIGWFLFAPALLKAQDAYQGLASKSVRELKGNGNRIVNKPFWIIWNRSYCSLHVNGTTYNFPVDPSYTKKLVEGYFEESFINEETQSTARGWFDVWIQHNKSGYSSVTINFPMTRDGFAYYIEKAERYSENGRVQGVIKVENWKEIEAKATEAKKHASATPKKEPEPILTPPAPAPPSRKTPVFSNVEKMPEFEGGQSALLEYIKSHLAYPENATKNQIEGTVYVDFVVEVDGSINEAKVASKIDTDLEKEAIRIVTSMPKWKAGKQNGQNVAVSYRVPVKFRLH